MSVPNIHVLRGWLADTGQNFKYSEMVHLLQGKSIYSEDQCAKIAAAYFENQPGFPSEFKDEIGDVERAAATALEGYQTVSEIGGDARVQRAKQERRRVKKEESWETLFERVDIHKTAPEIEQVRWAYNFVDVNPSLIEPEDVPSCGALSLVKRMNRNDAFYQAMVTKIIDKLLPDKRTLEYESRFQDDGRQELERIEEFERLFKAAREANERRTASGVTGQEDMPVS